MKVNHKEKLESLLEGSPAWLKTSYIGFMRIIKYGLLLIGILPKLDKCCQQSPRIHYYRSLLAIHHLEDMIFLEVPWWTYAAIEAIETHFQQMEHKPSVFEYGSGASTIWLAKRCTNVISIEHDLAWYHKLKPQIDLYPHVHLLLKRPEPSLFATYRSLKIPSLSFQVYVEAIREFNQTFDVIVIDGRSREACLLECLPYLKPNGLIIFDNSNRRRYQKVLSASGLLVERFYGRVPGSVFKSETAVLRKP